VFHAQGRVASPQHNSSHPDEREQERVIWDPVVPKQHKEYRKKYVLTVSPPMLVDESTGNLTTDGTGGTNVVLHLGPLDYAKVDGDIGNQPTEVTG